MISVCIATYNGEKFIKQQLESILSQLSSEDEIIISDDGSIDETLKIIKGFNDKRIHVYEHVKRTDLNKSKKGLGFYFATDNFSNALKHVHGDYVFLCDQDDIWYENKVEKCLFLLNTYDCVLHNYTIIDINGNITKKANFDRTPIHNNLLRNLIDDHFRGCCMAFKACWLELILPIPKNVMVHDFWIGLIIMKFGKFYYELEPLIKSRWYETSVSAKRKTSLIYKLGYRFVLMNEVRKRSKKR